MKFFRPWFFQKYFYPDVIYRVRTNEKILYLTFDDGPGPGSTKILLSILEKYGIKSMFFCSGKKVEKYGYLVKLIKDQGHLIGNHGYNHLNGWLTPTKEYIKDIITASKLTPDKIFRPPYGRLRWGQYKRLRKTFRLVFWDLMPYDFDKSFGGASSLRILKSKIRPGSIIVLHDTSSSSCNKILEDFIIYALKSGYGFELLSKESLCF